MLRNFQARQVKQASTDLGQSPQFASPVSSKCPFFLRVRENQWDRLERKLERLKDKYNALPDSDEYRKVSRADVLIEAIEAGLKVLSGKGK